MVTIVTLFCQVTFFVMICCLQIVSYNVWLVVICFSQYLCFMTKIKSANMEEKNSTTGKSTDMNNTKFVFPAG